MFAKTQPPPLFRRNLMTTLTDRKIVNHVNRIAGKCIGKSWGANYFSGTIPSTKIEKVFNHLVEMGFSEYNDPFKVEGVRSLQNGDFRVHVRPTDRGDWYAQVSKIERVVIPMD
jgi:hypothetical protein